MHLSPPPKPFVFPARPQVTAALERAAARAHALAVQTGTQLVVTTSSVQSPALKAVTLQKPS
jgi:hypothetical protein